MAEQPNGNMLENAEAQQPSGNNSQEDTTAQQPSDCLNESSTLEAFFSEAGSFRKFELMIEDKSIFVNAHYLAQLSPFFAALCFDDFQEKMEQKAFIGDETFQDILTLISCVHPTSGPFQPVTVDNFVVLARLADKYQINLLLELCETFIVDEKLPFNNTPISEPQLLAILRAVIEFRVEGGKGAMMKLLKRAAKFSVAELKEHKAHTWLPSGASAALFLAAKENEVAQAAAPAPATGQAPKPVATTSTTVVYLSPIHEIDETMII